MLSLLWIILAAPALAVPITSTTCIGHSTPIPLPDRRHQGLILAHTVEELGKPVEEWEREMTEVTEKVAFFDDGYMDDGQMFNIITTIPDRVSERYSPIQNVELEGGENKRERWLELLRESKVLIMSQVQGNELSIQDAYCAGVTVIHVIDTHVMTAPSQQQSPQMPLRIKSHTESLTEHIIRVSKGDPDELVKAIDRVGMSSATWL